MIIGICIYSTSYPTFCRGDICPFALTLQYVAIIRTDKDIGRDSLTPKDAGNV